MEDNYHAQTYNWPKPQESGWPQHVENFVAQSIVDNKNTRIPSSTSGGMGTARPPEHIVTSSAGCLVWWYGSRFWVRYVLGSIPRAALTPLVQNPLHHVQWKCVCVLRFV